MTLSPQQEAQRLGDDGSWHLIPDAILVDVESGVAHTPRGEVRGVLRVVDVASSDDAESSALSVAKGQAAEADAAPGAVIPAFAGYAVSATLPLAAPIVLVDLDK